MALLDSLTKAAKGFFIEDDETAPAAQTPRGLTPALVPPTAPAAGPVPPVAQAEQRHLDHIAGLLSSADGKDFGAYTKMVSSMAGSGLTGPLLYQTAFNAFAALTGVNQAGLLASAGQLATKLADDRARVQQRHREKLGESPAGHEAKAPPGPLALLHQRETQLQAEVATLTEQLATKSQQLRETQQQAQAERQKTQAALASYELAHAAAAAELQAHRQAAQSFLTASTSNA